MRVVRPVNHIVARETGIGICLIGQQDCLVVRWCLVSSDDSECALVTCGLGHQRLYDRWLLRKLDRECGDNKSSQE
jgi:hypothetical protein